MLAVADTSVLKSDYILPPDYEIMTETAEVFTKAMLLGIEPEQNNFADDVDILPFEEAVAYMRRRLPMDGKTYYALADKMRYRAFTVSRLADGDAVRNVQSMLVKAMDEGSGIQQFLQLTEGQLADAAGMGKGAGWYYETVYRTNTATAYNVGRAIAFEETPPVALELIGIDDARQTEICHSLTVPPFRKPYNDPVWEHMWPPFHFNCRTTVRAIYDESEIEDAGGPDKFYTQGAPDYTPDKGFGTYPLDKTDTWWDLTAPMEERAGVYGLEGEFAEARERLVEGAGGQEELLEKVDGATWEGGADIEKILGIQKGEPIETERAYKEANPNEYRENCQRCVAAYELRRRGYDVIAMSRHEKWGPPGYEAFNNPKVIGHAKAFGGDGTKLNKKILISQLNSLPDGSRCGILIKYRGSNNGHTFICEKVSGGLQFYDPQTGEECFSKLDKASPGYFAYYRMDNLSLSAGIDWKDYVKGKL